MSAHPDIRGPLPSFTPGPWHYQPLAGKHEFAVYADSTNGGDVALVRDFNEGNAALIAAAPELLETAREYLRAVIHTYGLPPHLDRVTEALKYAIAKADGAQ